MSRPGGRAFRVRCAVCAADIATDGRCLTCGGVPVLDLEPLVRAPRAAEAQGIWRYREVLPATRSEVTLGEGSTPLVTLSGAGPGPVVHAKMESLNPTLSFKDRGMALAASWALDRRLRGLVVASTGNAAVSASAYAAAAGLECRVLVGSGSRAAGKLSACRSYGADVSEIDGDYSDAYAAAAASVADGWLNVSTTYQNPMIAEAYRTTALELVAELGAAPHTVVVPIGAGPLLRGLSRGFDDLRATGAIDAVPRLVGVQAAACAPIVRAWDEGRDATAWRGSLARPFSAGATSATAIADPLRGYEDHGLLTLEAIDRTRGSAVSVSENEIARAGADLLGRGIWVEPSSATALAALARLTVPEGVDIVLLLTGHGTKAA